MIQLNIVMCDIILRIVVRLVETYEFVTHRVYAVVRKDRVKLIHHQAALGVVDPKLTVSSMRHNRIGFLKLIILFEIVDVARWCGYVYVFICVDLFVFGDGLVLVDKFYGRR